MIRLLTENSSFSLWLSFFQFPSPLVFHQERITSHLSEINGTLGWMFYIKIKFLVRSIHPLPPSDMPDLLKAYKELGDWIIYSGLNVDRMMKGKTL